MKESTEEEITGAIKLTIASEWQRIFIPTIAQPIESNIDSIYSHYRKDQSIFSNSGNSKQYNASPPSIGTGDRRVMNWLAEVDKFYLGKFITDEDTQRRLTKTIGDHINDFKTIRDKETIGKFTDAVKGTVLDESWKITRIIETSVNKTRNYAHVNYLDQLGFTTYEVVEIMDQITCDWCSYMNGKQFSVSMAKANMNKAVSSDPSEVPLISPFATTIKIDQFKTLSAEQLQNMGINCPSYHPHCRGRIIAVFDSASTGGTQSGTSGNTSPAGYNSSGYKSVYKNPTGKGEVQQHYLQNAGEVEENLLFAKSISKYGHLVKLLPYLEQNQHLQQKNPDASIDGTVADFKNPTKTKNPGSRISSLISEANKQGANIVVIGIDNPAINFASLKKALRSATQPTFNHNIKEIWLMDRANKIVKIKRSEISDWSFLKDLEKIDYTE